MKGEPILKRFEDKIFHSPCGCWYWVGAVGVHGYGVMIIDYKYVMSHRVSYELYKGEIPNGLNVCHSCDVTLCVNPDHLFLGTHKDNMKDRDKKGRNVHGIRSPESKLDELQVLVIRELASNGINQDKLAEYFNINQSSVSLIKNKINWKHI